MTIPARQRRPSPSSRPVEWCEAIIAPTKADEIAAMPRTGEYAGCIELIDFYEYRFKNLPIISVPHPSK